MNRIRTTYPNSKTYPLQLHLPLLTSACDTTATKLGAMVLETQQIPCFYSVEAPKIIRVKTFLNGPEAF
jgi:hypothetical protein